MKNNNEDKAIETTIINEDIEIRTSNGSINPSFITRDSINIQTPEEGKKK